MKNPYIDEHGNKYWMNSKRQLHRDDGPAQECADGSKAWYINGKRHREDGPAIEWVANIIDLMNNGINAQIFFNAYKQWWINGKQIE